MAGICYKCGGKGLEPTCPKCGKEKVGKTISLEHNKNIEQTIKVAKFYDIPEGYLGNEWNKNIVLSTKSSVFNTTASRDFLDGLDKIHSTFINGNVYNKSFFIFSPSNTGKDVFVYSCMQFAMKNGFKVAPYLDTVDAKRLITVSSIDPKYKLFGKYSYDMYMMSEVLFLRIPTNEYIEYSYDTCKFILEKRYKLGLPTFIISTHSLDEVSRYSVTKSQVDKWKEVPELNIDEKKYPIVMGFK